MSDVTRACLPPGTHRSTSPAQTGMSSVALAGYSCCNHSLLAHFDISTTKNSSAICAGNGQQTVIASRSPTQSTYIPQLYQGRGPLSASAERLRTASCWRCLDISFPHRCGVIGHELCFECFGTRPLAGSRGSCPAGGREFPARHQWYKSWPQCRSARGVQRCASPRAISETCPCWEKSLELFALGGFWMRPLSILDLHNSLRCRHRRCCPRGCMRERARNRSLAGHV